MKKIAILILTVTMICAGSSAVSAEEWEDKKYHKKKKYTQAQMDGAYDEGFRMGFAGGHDKMRVTFDMFENTLHIPYFEAGEKSYRMVLKRVSTDPMVFELVEVDEIDREEIGEECEAGDEECDEEREDDCEEGDEECEEFPDDECEDGDEECEDDGAEDEDDEEVADEEEEEAAF